MSFLPRGRAYWFSWEERSLLGEAWFCLELSAAGADCGWLGRTGWAYPARKDTPRNSPRDTKIAMVETLIGEETFIRSEEHTSELQSQSNLVCRLLLEKKKKK